MIALNCKRCGYRFESEKMRKSCPYCGEEAVELEKNAAELIDSVEED